MYTQNNLNTFHSHRMDTTKVRLSDLNPFHKANAFKHHDYDCLPMLIYLLDRDGLKTEKVQAAIHKTSELVHWQNNFWDTLSDDGKKYKEIYERELSSTVRNAINSLTEKWTDFYIKETNTKFSDLI